MMNFQIFNFYCGKNNDQWKLAGEVDELRRPFQQDSTTTDEDETTADQGSRTTDEDSTSTDQESTTIPSEMNPDDYQKYILGKLEGKKTTSMLLIQQC